MNHVRHRCRMLAAILVVLVGFRLSAAPPRGIASPSGVRVVAVTGAITDPVARTTRRLVGYNEFRTNLPGGRHANVRTTRAMVMRIVVFVVRIQLGSVIVYM